MSTTAPSTKLYSRRERGSARNRAVQKFDVHPRCGTSFLMTVMLISIGSICWFRSRLSGHDSHRALCCCRSSPGSRMKSFAFAARHRGSLFALMTAPGLCCSASPRSLRPTSRRNAPSLRSISHGPGKTEWWRTGECLGGLPRRVPGSQFSAKPIE